MHGVRAGDVVAGYRIVRTLGSGERADVYLGHADVPHESSDPHESSEPRSVAIKLYRPAAIGQGTSFTAVEQEVRALTRAAHPHVVRLLSRTAASDSRAGVILERLGRGSLERLLQSRGAISAGEAVTILAPIASAVEAMHDAGIAHHGIRPGLILFRDSGAPVLGGFGGAGELKPGVAGAVRSADPDVRSDITALAVVTRTVLERVSGTDAARLTLWLDHWVNDSSLGAPARALSERLFELGTAEPVRFVDRGEVTRAPQGVPSRVGARVAPASTENPRTGAEAAPAASPRPAWLAALNVPEWLDAPLRIVHAATGRDAIRKLRVSLAAAVRNPVQKPGPGRVRTPVWIAAGAVAIVLAGVVALLPRDDSGDDVSAAAPTMTSPAGDAGGDAHGAGTAEETGTADETGTAEENDAVGGDDPVAALGALVELRNRCVRDLSVLCLDDVLQASSAAMEDDALLIRAIQDGGEVLDAAVLVTGDAVLVERLGDSAIVSLGTGGTAVNGQPTSTLLMKGEAGWRIRDYLDY